LRSFVLDRVVDFCALKARTKFGRKRSNANPGKLIEQADENTIWGGSRKYNMGRERKMQEEANAEHTSGPYDESPQGGGRRHSESPKIYTFPIRVHMGVPDAYTPHNNTGMLHKSWIVGPSRPINAIWTKSTNEKNVAKTESTCGGKCCKY